MNEPLVTVLLPNYKTPELTKICVRLLNKYTAPGKLRIVAVDNDSGDGSLEYLRSIPWIELIERKDIAGEAGPLMHAKALDQGFGKVTTKYVLVIHTDTLVIHPEWLDYLLRQIEADENIAGVGSWKLEYVSPLKAFGKKIENVFRRLAGKKVGKEEHYLRSHCALYRTELIRQHTNGFNDQKTAGLSIHRILTEKGYQMKFLLSEDLGKYIRHLNHATGVLNPSAGSRRDRKKKSRKRIQGSLEFFRDILEADELDIRKGDA